MKTVRTGQDRRLTYRRSGYADTEIHLLSDGRVADPPGHAEIFWDTGQNGVFHFLDANRSVSAELTLKGNRYRGTLFGRIYVELFDPRGPAVSHGIGGEMRYVLGIPYVNRYDLLVKAVASVECLHDHLLIIDNSENLELRDSNLHGCFETVEPSVPLTFTQSQNLLQRLARERRCNVLLCMHSDGEAAPGTQIRDWIASNTATGGFWEAMRQRHDALNVVWECKNYADLKAEDLHQANYYAGSMTGLVIIAYRGTRETKKHYCEHIKEISRKHSGKAIVLLVNDQDLRTFIRQVLSGKFRDSHFRAIYDDTARAIS